ncbi:heptaprenyl diphosphate synthase component 1 [Fictibacillus sp. Mic-4]|uniref:heptaprenyl diphosphate synthase component 1 n=1 Tax=Fictibacillus sp. Mic-4 TaxID=3132826 RepID=UPI003CED3295
MKFNHEEVNKLNQLVMEKLEHSYLKEYVNVPLINSDKAILAYWLLREKGFQEELLGEYYCSIMLVQLALDTHEEILNISGENKKMRQLLVLAGDYYSSLYYDLLAEIEDIAFIRALAEGIRKINEYKMKVHHAEELLPDEWLAAKKGIESSLLMEVAEHLGMEKFTSFISHFLFISCASDWKEHVRAGKLIQQEIDSSIKRLQSIEVPVMLQSVVQNRMNSLLGKKHAQLGEG